MTAEGQWCMAWVPPRQGGGATTRAALDTRTKWAPGETVTVAFLDGEKSVQDRIKKVAKEWTGDNMANVRFSFVNDPAQADIRITFQYPGSWSLLGNTCRQYRNGEATMNYGWLTPNSADSELRRVVLHEFGHALGLIHEHQNPAGGIPWNKEVIYRELGGPPNNWDRPTIDRNMFQVYDRNVTNHTQVDPKSIMMYPIAKSWVTDPKYAVDLNAELSETDKKFIREQYK